MSSDNSSFWGNIVWQDPFFAKQYFYIEPEEVSVVDHWEHIGDVPVGSFINDKKNLDKTIFPERKMLFGSP
jgi:hypothetical protein